MFTLSTLAPKPQLVNRQSGVFVKLTFMLDKYSKVHYAVFMNRLPIEKRAQIIQMLVEGASLRATSRMADVSINTVTKLLLDVADAAHSYHDQAVRKVRCCRVQVDEIWCFVRRSKRPLRLTRKPRDGETFGPGRPLTQTQSSVSGTSLADA